MEEEMEVGRRVEKTITGLHAQCQNFKAKVVERKKRPVIDATSVCKMRLLINPEKVSEMTVVESKVESKELK